MEKGQSNRKPLAFGTGGVQMSSAVERHFTFAAKQPIATTGLQACGKKVFGVGRPKVNLEPRRLKVPEGIRWHPSRGFLGAFAAAQSREGCEAANG